jgi:hypothetical protein
MVATGATDADVAAAAEAVRAQIAFYASTPAYRIVLDVHGWGDLQPQLQERTRAGDWAGMAALVHDDLLEAVAIIAPPDEVAPAIEERYGAYLDRVAVNAVYGLDSDIATAIAADLRPAERQER